MLSLDFYHGRSGSRVYGHYIHIASLGGFESTGFNVQPLGKRLSRSILYSTSGFFNEDNYTNRTEGKFACYRGYRDTVEGASKRMKDTSINKTKFNCKHLSFPSFVRGLRLFFPMCRSTILQRLSNSRYFCFGGSNFFHRSLDR